MTAHRWRPPGKITPAENFGWHPIFLPAKHQKTLTEGFGNTVIWPLFYYFPSYVEFSFAAYQDFFDMNRRFADNLVRCLQPADTVWIHDYQLLPFAAILHRRFPEHHGNSCSATPNEKK